MFLPAHRTAIFLLADSSFKFQFWFFEKSQSYKGEKISKNTHIQWDLSKSIPFCVHNLYEGLVKGYYQILLLLQIQSQGTTCLKHCQHNWLGWGYPSLTGMNSTNSTLVGFQPIKQPNLIWLSASQSNWDTLNLANYAGSELRHTKLLPPRGMPLDRLFRISLWNLISSVQSSNINHKKGKSHRFGKGWEEKS
jgi:hypothetical protein